MSREFVMRREYPSQKELAENKYVVGHKKRWDLCSMHMCRAKTWSGLPEREIEKRFCSKHLPNRIGVSERVKQKHCLGFRGECKTHEFETKSVCETYKWMIQTQGTQCFNFDRDEIPNNGRCNAVLRKLRCVFPIVKKRVGERTQWIVVGKNSYGEKVYVTDVAGNGRKKVKGTRFSIHRDYAMKFENLEIAKAHLSRAIEYLRWQDHYRWGKDNKKGKTLKLIKFYPDRAKQNTKKRPYLAIIPRELDELGDVNLKSAVSRRRAFKLLVKYGPISKENFDRIYGSNSNQILESLKKRMKVVCEEGNWRALRMVGLQEFEP